MYREMNPADIIFGGTAIAFKTAVGAGVLALVAHGIVPDAAQDTNPTAGHNTNSASQSCSSERARQLPTAADVETIVDQRRGNVYACNYFQDLELPYNNPTKIHKITNEVYDATSSEFDQSGTLSGFAILGTGLLSGEFTGSGDEKTERRRVYVIRAEDNNREVRTIVLDAEKVAVKPCKDETDCQPTVEFKIGDNPLWNKDTGTQNKFHLENEAPDNTSIWLAAGFHDESNLDATRLKVVNQLSVKLADEQAASGGPDLPGQVISSLAKVVLTLPASAVQ